MSSVHSPRPAQPHPDGKSIDPKIDTTGQSTPKSCRHIQTLTLSLPRVTNFKFLLQPHQKYNIAQYEELGFSSLTQMKDDSTTNSHYITYTFLFERLGEFMYFWSLGVKWLSAVSVNSALLGDRKWNLVETIDRERFPALHEPRG